MSETLRPNLDRRPAFTRGQAGFTLVEIMIVVMLMALFASAAALSMNGGLAAARAQDAAETIGAFDASARTYARRFHVGVQMVFDLSAGRISRREKGDSQNDRAAALVPRGFTIDEVRRAGHSTSVGETRIEVSEMGWSASYAVHLLGPGGDFWLVVAGLSGQVQRVQDERTIDAILASGGKAAISNGPAPGRDAD